MSPVHLFAIVLPLEGETAERQVDIDPRWASLKQVNARVLTRRIATLAIQASIGK